MEDRENGRHLMERLSQLACENNRIKPELFAKYAVKRGLRDEDGRGVLVGLTEVGDVRSYILDEGEIVPVPGKLIYRGIDIYQLAGGYLEEKRYGFEEVIYLLLFGVLPLEEELACFKEVLGEQRKLPEDFVRDIILKAPSKDMMNSLARSVLALYSFDSSPEDTSTANVLRQTLTLIAQFPALTVYGYQAYVHYHKGKSLVIHSPRPELGTAENILHMLRPNSQYTRLEVELLDLALILHAEHGGGNNSTFTTHLVTSTGTDTYAVMAAALGSLKGPKHGGANIKVVQMFEDMKQSLSDWTDEGAIRLYLEKLLQKQAFDKKGLIYGIGHAVYSVSDPRAAILKDYAKKLAAEKGLEAEYTLYTKVEALAPGIIESQHHNMRNVSANVDFYSGFVYSMLDLPMELYTPLFAISRIVGWGAHRLEEVVNEGKIIRPAYKSVATKQEYVSLKMRK